MLSASQPTPTAYRVYARGDNNGRLILQGVVVYVDQIGIAEHAVVRFRWAGSRELRTLKAAAWENWPKEPIERFPVRLTPKFDT